MREVGGKAYFEALMAAFEKNLMDHIAVYGPDNDKRLTGKHETAPWNKFSYGVADRGASIRVPHSFVKNDYKGYLEDRRPNSQGDPYADRFADPEDRRRSSDRREGGRGLSDQRYPGWGHPGCNSDPPKRNRFGGSLRFDDTCILMMLIQIRRIQGRSPALSNRAR